MACGTCSCFLLNDNLLALMSEVRLIVHWPAAGEFYRSMAPG